MHRVSAGGTSALVLNFRSCNVALVEISDGDKDKSYVAWQELVGGPLDTLFGL